MKRINLNDLGFTIVETIFVIFATVLILSALFVIFNWHGKLFNLEQAQVQVSGTARNSMTEMQQYILQTNRVLASHSVNGTSYSSGTQQLVLQLPSIDNSNQVIPNTWDYAAFYVSGTNLFETVEVDASSTRSAVSQRLLSNSVSTLTITYDNADFTQVQKVTVDLQTSQKVHSQNVVDHLQESTYLRNY